MARGPHQPGGQQQQAERGLHLARSSGGRQGEHFLWMAPLAIDGLVIISPKNDFSKKSFTLSVMKVLFSLNILSICFQI